MNIYLTRANGKKSIKLGMETRLCIKYENIDTSPGRQLSRRTRMQFHYLVEPKQLPLDTSKLYKHVIIVFNDENRQLFKNTLGQE